MPDKPAYGPNHPFIAKIVDRQPLGSPRSDRETLHLAVDLAPDGPAYECGNTLGLYPRNPAEAVAQFLTLVHIDGGETVHLPRGEAPLPLREALEAKLHFLARPTAALLKAFAESTSSPTERDHLMALADGPSEAFAQYAAQRQIPDVLAEHPSAHLDAQRLAALLPPLNPRLYSISSSPLAYPHEAHLCVGVERYDALGKPRWGVASTWLADRVEVGVTPVPVFISKGTMQLPADDARDIVMIGPGTGIAPFRAFLQERQARGAKGRNWLFYGHRSEVDDFYYRDEIEAWQKSGLLTKLSLAWSRNGEEKRYVQHLLWENRDELWQWIEKGATIYLCGRKAPMAADVEAMLCRIALDKKAADSPESAATWLADMKKNRRFQRDVY